MPQSEITDIIRSSLQHYPKLEKSIENLEKHSIVCKCSVTSRLNFRIEKVHGFSSNPCASDYCINRIIGENKHNNILNYFGKKDTNSGNKNNAKSTDRRKTNLNGKLIINDKNLEDMNRALDYYTKIRKNSEFTERSTVFDSYINPPDFRSKIPYRFSYSPNLSFPKPPRATKTII